VAFQPFGPRFDIRSPLPPEGVKAAVRTRKKRWFDHKRGARGWIAGPFICLWWHPYNQQGPMLLGRIVEDGSGTRISGRAGLDLNGVIAVVLIAVAAIPITWLLVSSGQASLEGALRVAGIFAALLALGFWARSFFHREAEPLLRFLRNAVTPKEAGRD
jgi:hypothetical protein